MRGKKLLAATLCLTVAFAAVAVCVPGATLGAQAQKTITATYPYDGQTVTTVKPAVYNYVSSMRAQARNIDDDYVINDLDGDNVKVKEYCRAEYLDGVSKDIVLAFKAENFPQGATFTVKVADNAGLENAKEYTAGGTFVTVNNLYRNAVYYWQVEEKTSGVKSEVLSFTTGDYVRMLTVRGESYRISNVRDMGGTLVEDGRRIKQGLIFRGSELNAEDYSQNGGDHSKNLDEGVLDILLNQLGIGIEVDLRGEAEANYITASPLGSTVDYMRITNGAGGGYAALWNGADNFCQEDSLNGTVKNKDLLKRLFAEVFTNANEKHVYFHCWGGADRTGTIAFLLGGVLGVSYTDLVMDYEYTSFSYNYRPHDENDPKGVYSFPKMIDAIKNSQYYSQGKKLSAVIADWMIGELGMTSAQIETLRNNLLE